MTATQPNQSEAPSTMFAHCKTVYEAMLEHAKEVVIDSDWPSGADDDPPLPDTMIVYEGMFTKLVTQDLRMSVPYYSSIRRMLIEMGCIRQLRRGGGNSKSQWELVREPTEENFADLRPKKQARETKANMQQEQINAINNRVNTLEQRFDQLIKGLST